MVRESGVSEKSCLSYTYEVLILYAWKKLLPISNNSALESVKAVLTLAFKILKKFVLCNLPDSGNKQFTHTLC